MKNDSSRNTFDARRHFSSVRMQQGRVQLDADWNEQSDIIAHRAETAAGDLVGPCGGPLHAAAFHVVTDLSQLTDEERGRPENQTPPEGYAPPDFLISAGRYYVDGILCENEGLTSYHQQPDLTGAARITAAGLYLVYLDVWQRHLTALDAPGIREVALGGPDTATRAKTVWQVKALFLGEEAEGSCLSEFAQYEYLTAPSSGRLSARTRRERSSADPCVVPPGAGYRGLENQHYRVEIHEGGEALDVSAAGAVKRATRVRNRNDQVVVAAGGDWEPGQAVEIFSDDPSSDPLNGTLAHITHEDDPEAGSQTLTLNVNVSKLALDELRLRAVGATYKWSRDNGAVVTAVNSITNNEVTVHDLGPDDALGFREGQWVELTDDALELDGRPGQLAQIVKIDEAINLVTLNFAPAHLGSDDGVNKALHPKLRRWDGVGTVKFDPDDAGEGYLDLESGVQVRFTAGTYRTGDYWNIPARTATADAQSGNIEWPQVSGEPQELPPFGIRHHYCRLALVRSDGASLAVLSDCRNLFPPVTELTTLLYVGGDGQEAMPGDPLPRLLEVGVFNGRWPVAGAQVKFDTRDNGRLATDIAGLETSTDETLIVTTGPDGIASCAWKLAAPAAREEVRPSARPRRRALKTSQQAVARLLDADGDDLPQVVRFNGQLSIAAQVAYDPGACAALREQTTVQQAIDRLSELASLHKLSGDGQQLTPGGTLEPLRVLLANRCGKITGRRAVVVFRVASGSGRVGDGVRPPAPSVEITADDDGVAACFWQPDPKTAFQEVEAFLKDDASRPTAAPAAVRFSATVPLASFVGYSPTPDDCPNLAGATTVQEALDKLCSIQSGGGGGGCEVVVGEGGEFARLDEALLKLTEQGQAGICICLLPGEHILEAGLDIQAGRPDMHIKITGCGRGSRIRIPAATARPGGGAFNLGSFTLRDVELFSETPVEFQMCGEVAFEGCRLINENQKSHFIRITGARRVRFENNVVSATRPPEGGVVPPDSVFIRVQNAGNLAELYRIKDEAEFNERASQVASELARRDAGVQQQIGAQTARALSEVRMRAAQRASFDDFLDLMREGSRPREASLRDSLVGIRQASLQGAPGSAIILSDASADAWLTDNDIHGVVSLYGEPSEAVLTEEDLRNIAGSFGDGMIQFINSRKSLHVRDNVLHRVVVSGHLISALKAYASRIETSSGPPLMELYRRCFISGNVFKGGDNSLVMEHLSLSANSFEVQSDEQGSVNAGAVFAQAATHVSNHAPNYIHLFSLSNERGAAANMLINIVHV